AAAIIGQVIEYQYAAANVRSNQQQAAHPIAQEAASITSLQAQSLSSSATHASIQRSK
ncbi:hypothetical protein Dimus_037005, partial [Dionaea muscipula]